jgi:competence protein ComEC
MSKLKITLIDVGWGDSVLIESIDSYNNTYYALIDSNDTQYLRPSMIFLKRHFEKAGIDIQNEKPIFDFVLLSHAHADHAQGLKSIMKEFGTRNFYYPKSTNWTSSVSLIRYANRSSNVGWHQAIDTTKAIPDLGDVSIEVLWPEHNNIDHHNENNNSVVLQLTLSDKSFVLTGDAEDDVWANIATKLPSNLSYFKVPHHGSVNGAFEYGDPSRNPCWINNLNISTIIGISSHIKPHKHPHQEVIDLLDTYHNEFYRTDQNYHLIYENEYDGTTSNHSMKYSH